MPEKWLVMYICTTGYCFCLVLRFFDWILELLWQCDIFLFFISKHGLVMVFTSLLTIFQLYCGSQFLVGGNHNTWRKPQTCRKPLTNVITYCCIECTSPERDSNSHPTTIRSWPWQLLPFHYIKIYNQTISRFFCENYTLMLSSYHSPGYI
jgi:hypothetical protein